MQYKGCCDEAYRFFPRLSYPQWKYLYTARAPEKLEWTPLRGARFSRTRRSVGASARPLGPTPLLFPADGPISPGIGPRPGRAKFSGKIRSLLWFCEPRPGGLVPSRVLHPKIRLGGSLPTQATRALWALRTPRKRGRNPFSALWSARRVRKHV